MALDRLPLSRSYRYLLKCICICVLLWVVRHLSAFTQLSATDVSVRTTMKGAAKCDKHCELQNSVNQWILERALHSRDIPGSMPASVLVEPSCRCGPSCVHSPASLCAMAALSGGASGTCRSVRRELQLLQLVSLHHTFVTDSCGAPTNSS